MRTRNMPPVLWVEHPKAIPPEPAPTPTTAEAEVPPVQVSQANLQLAMTGACRGYMAMAALAVRDARSVEHHRPDVLAEAEAVAAELQAFIEAIR